MNMTLSQMLAAFFGWCCTMARFLWLVFWLLVVSASPVAWCDVVERGPSWFTQHGWAVGVAPSEGPTIVVNGQQVDLGGYYVHVPSIAACIMCDGVFLVIAFAPFNKWYR